MSPMVSGEDGSAMYVRDYNEAAPERNVESGDDLGRHWVTR